MELVLRLINRLPSLNVLPAFALAIGLFCFLGILLSFLIVFSFLKNSVKYLNFKNLNYCIIVSGLLISVELKTDSLLLPDGVVMFFLNLFLIIIFQKILIENQVHYENKS